MVSAPRRVLFIDDEPHVRDLVRGMLPTEDVVGASSGPEALVIAQNLSFDVILVDLAMPQMDGFQLIDGLRTMARHEMTPIVAVSGVYSEEDAVDRVLAQGAAGFLPKPFDKDQLLRVLDHVAAKPKK